MNEQAWQSLYEDVKSDNDTLRQELQSARAIAARWEIEAHSLRRELQAIRMECDTRRLERPRS